MIYRVVIVSIFLLLGIVGYSAETDQKARSKCIQRRTEVYIRLGARYKKFWKDWQNKEMPEALLGLLGCDKPDTRKENFDNSFILTFYHEGIHHLSTLGDLIKNPPPGAQAYVKQTSELSIKTYKYYVNVNRDFAEVPYLEGMPKIHEIYLKLLPYQGVLENLDLYFKKTESNSANNFYQLLDEWNAYYESLAICSHLLEDCKVKRMINGKLLSEHDNSLNALLSYYVYADFYLSNLKEKKPELFKKIIEDPRFILLLQRLLPGSNEFTHLHWKEIQCCIAPDEKYDQLSIIALKSREHLGVLLGFYVYADKNPKAKQR